MVIDLGKTKILAVRTAKNMTESWSPKGENNHAPLFFPVVQNLTHTSLVLA